MWASAAPARWAFLCPVYRSGSSIPKGTPRHDGETGEIHLRGANVFSGYWNRPDATQEAFRDGWFRTGDLAIRSPDGYYTLVGRRSDLIISGGFNIYPREIEEFLTEQPEIAEAAVIGVPDRIRGEMPVAYVVERSPVNSRDLEDRCRAALASYKVPRAFIPVDKLPRNAMGKIQKHLLPRTRRRVGRGQAALSTTCGSDGRAANGLGTVKPVPYAVHVSDRGG